MEPKPSSTDLTTFGQFNLPTSDQLDLKNMLETMRRDSNIPSAQKRKIIRQQYELLLKYLLEQSNAALEMEKEKLESQKLLGHRVLVTQVETITLQIRDRFLDAVYTLGFTVEMKQLNFLTEFAESLKAFRNKLSKKDIDENEKSIIEDLSKKAFERLKDKLTQLTADIIDRAIPPEKL